MAFPVTQPSLAQALAARGYNEPTSVQSAVLQPEARDRDLLVSAQTGSGKTVAFGLALANTIMDEAGYLPRTQNPLVLVIAPTRELALQVHAELSWLYQVAGGRILSCVGGMDARREAKHLAAGCHIVVGTPGRLVDHIQRGHLKLNEIEAVVLDEADEMLDMGFKEELDAILSATPATRRTLLFSATISKEIAGLARDYQNNALRVDTISRSEPHADIDYRAVLVASHESEAALVNVLRAQSERALVFCATREGVKHLHASLLARGFAAVAISGELSQSERNAALDALRESRAQVCIATDVAARGLDLPDLGLVIHVDLPTNKATLLHRSGRTGRAGKKGTCLLLVPPMKKRRAEILLSSANINATWQTPPTSADIALLDDARLLEHPALVQTPDADEARAAAALLERFSPEILAAAFVRLARTNLPKPVHVTLLSLDSPRAARPARANAEPYAGGGTTGWFRLPVGRAQNADPRWLIPLICKRGGITKAEIGSIRIFDRETKFEIAPHALSDFTNAVSTTPPGDAPIDAAAAPAPRAERGSGPRPGPARAPYAGDSPRPPRPPRPENAPGGPLTEQQRRRKNKAVKGPR